MYFFVSCSFSQESFFAEHSFEAGISLQVPGLAAFLFFGRLKILVADEVAIKQSLENKGSAGKLFCCRCANVLSKSSFRTIRRSGDFVPSTCLDWESFQLHTNDTVRNLVQYLVAQSESLSHADLAKLETALGFNYRKGGLLLHAKFGREIPEAVHFDWFHIYLVHGLASTEAGLLCGALVDCGFPSTRVDSFVESFKWPRQFAGSTPKKVFSDRDGRYDAAKCSASEMLNLLPVLRLFVLLFAWGHDVTDRAAYTSFLNLVAVIDMLVAINRGKKVRPQELKAAVLNHLRSFLARYQDESWVPKAHMAQHLHEFLTRHGTLISCFTHERKHRLVKRFASQMVSPTNAFEKGLCQDILHVQLGNLKELEVQPRFQGVARLEDPKPAAGQVKELGQQLFGNALVHTSLVVNCGGLSIGKDDVVHCVIDGVVTVAKIWYHFQERQRVLTCLCPWQHVHDHVYRVLDEPCIVDTSAINRLCVFSIKDGSGLVVPV